MKALARLVGPVPSHDHPIKLQDLLLEAEQLSAERGKARAGNLRHPFVARVGNNMQQFHDTFTPDRRDNAELGKVARIELITAVGCSLKFAMHWPSSSRTSLSAGIVPAAD